MGTFESFVCDMSERLRAEGVYTERNTVEKILCELAKKIDENTTGSSGHITVAVNLDKTNGTYMSNYSLAEIRQAAKSGCVCSLIVSFLQSDGTTPTACAIDVGNVLENSIAWDAFGIEITLFADGTFTMTG